jgi:nucleotide-binding universal stress UspA family protein
MHRPLAPRARAPPEDLAYVAERIDALTSGAWRLERPPTPGAPLELPEFRRILVALDGSDASRFALEWARRFGQAGAAEAWVVHVRPPPALVQHHGRALAQVGVPPPPRMLDDLAHRAGRMVDAAVEALRSSGMEAEGRVVQGTALGGLLAMAHEQDADLAIVGSHGRGGLGRLLLGSVADGVKDRFPGSVLVARTEGPGRRVLLPTDGSIASKHSTLVGVRLARAWGLPSTVLHVFDPLAFGDDDELRRMVEAAFPHLPAGESRADLTYELDVGNPGERIAATARDRGAGLVVMGSRGLTGFPGAVGSVGNRVAHEAEASVLLVKCRGDVGR